MPDIQIVDTSEAPGRRGKWNDTLREVREQLPLLPPNKSIRVAFNNEQDAHQCRMAWGHYRLRHDIAAKCTQDTEEPNVLWFIPKGAK